MSNEKYYKTAKFQQLQAKWYEKLAKTGFEDVEEANSPKELLKCWHSTWFRTRGTPEQFAEKQQYYATAREILANHRFDSAKEKRIWALHSEGYSRIETSRRMKVSARIVMWVLYRLKAELLRELTPATPILAMIDDVRSRLLAGQVPEHRVKRLIKILRKELLPS
jgi:hypothetical protein